MRFVGLDVHKRVVEAVIIDHAGEIVRRARLDCTRAALERFATEQLGRTDKVALEATTNTWGVVNVIAPLVGEVIVSNPLRTKAIAQAKVKTDKVDALVLGQLLRCNYLPTVWTPDSKTQELRALTTRRASLVADRTAVKNRLHSVLHQRLIHPPVKDLFGKAGLVWLKGLKLDALGKAALDSDLRLLDAIERELEAVTKSIVEAGYADARVKLLMTLPGVDVPVAETLIASLGDIKRFRDGDHAASYLGLVPSTRQSAERCYNGPITKHGNGHARWMLVQAAQHLGNHPGPLGVFFRRLAKKKNRNVAVVATARKLVVIAWHRLTKNQPYRYAQPATTQAKLQRLRVDATGRRRKSGNAKGSPRSAAYGTGRRSKGIPSLDQALLAEGLPATTPPPPAERRVIKRCGLTTFAARIQIPTRVPKLPRSNPAPTRSHNPLSETVARTARPVQKMLARAVHCAPLSAEDSSRFSSRPEKSDEGAGRKP